MTLNETKIDLSKIYFHGSSEPKISKLDAPSYEHPFYVTTDLHYAMAFCTKNSSSTGDWDIQKTFTPSSQNFVYVVTLAPNCNVFDFRDKKSTEFKKFYSIIDKDIVDWVLQSEDKFDHNDIYEFINALQFEIFKPIEEDTTYSMYYDRRTNASGHALNPYERTMPKYLFEKAYAFMRANGLEHAYQDMDIHEIMAPILKKLNSLGFQGILTTEHDSNEENFSRVTTRYAIGIFDVSGLDQLSLIPMKYSWLKKINPIYMQDKTSQNANEKIKRFIQLYKQIANQNSNVNESSLDSSNIWYFGNNRSRNIRIVKPNWNTPFFLTTSYEYAKDYSDYGVYKIELRNERNLNILNFNNQQEVQQLHWPEIVVKAIQSGKTDLNSIAYDLYVLAYGEGKKQPTWIKDSEEWRLAAYYFRDKSLGILDYATSGSVWGSEEDHVFLMQMWKDIHDAGFDGFMHLEFGQKVLALFNLRCIGKISAQPISEPLNEKIKNRLLKKEFKAKGQAAFPEIKSDDDIVFVSGIPKEKALKLLKKACHDVGHFHPEYMKKAVKWSDDQIFGVFNKHDKRNVLAMASIRYNGDESGAAYLHTMTGFIKGGYGKKLVIWLLQKFKKVYGQIALEGSGTKDNPYRPNEKLRDKFYATIPGVKIYRVENSIWDCPADFFYYGISDESIKEFLENTYSSKNQKLDESLENQPLVRELSQNEINELIENNKGVDISELKGYDVFECKIENSSFLIVGWKDFPKGYFCIVKTYMKYKTYNADKSFYDAIYSSSRNADDRFLQKILEAADYINKMHMKIWVPCAGHLKTINKKMGIDVNRRCLLDNYCSSNSSWMHEECDIKSTNDGIHSIFSWYQFKDTEVSPIEDLVNKLAKSDSSQTSSIESSHQSYFEVWQSKSSNSEESICREAGRKIDKKLEEVFGYSTLDEIINVLEDLQPKCNVNAWFDFLDELRDAMEKYYCNFNKLIDRKSWWDLIPDQVYKAIVSRSAHPEVSRGVSLKTLYSCLDKLCFDLTLLRMQSIEEYKWKIISSSKILSKIIDTGGDKKDSIDKQPIYYHIVNKIIEYCGSYEDPPYGPAAFTGNDRVMKKAFENIKSVAYDETDQLKIIAVISKTIDLFHDRGSLAGCFVEGGEKTCKEVSNMKPNEIYESKNIKIINEDDKTGINDINHMFDEVVSQYKTTFSIDLSYMKFKVDSQPVYTNGESCYEYDEDECAGDWTSLGWIRLNPDMKSVMDRYGVAWHGSDDIEEFTQFIIAHELAHEVWNNIADDQFKNDMIEKANDENFSTMYLETVNTNKLAEETFCEYLAHQIVQQMHTKR